MPHEPWMDNADDRVHFAPEDGTICLGQTKYVWMTVDMDQVNCAACIAELARRNGNTMARALLLSGPRVLLRASGVYHEAALARARRRRRRQADAATPRRP